jgi:enamine deaminase RidA (YjgF/YER057c/UK114 family)
MTTGIQRVDPPELAKARGFSHGVITPSGRQLFVAGQIAIAADSTIVSERFSAQFEKALANFMTVVKAAGGTGVGIASMTVFVTTIEEYLAELPEVGAAWRRQVGREFPAMALVEVSRLVVPTAKVEIMGVVSL